MVKWRYCLILAVLLLLPSGSGSQRDEDYDEERTEDEDDEGENDDDDEEEHSDKTRQGVERRAPAVLLRTTHSPLVTRTTKRRPLECYVCAYKSDSPLRACLDPTKYRVHTITCHRVDDKCFTSVISKGSTYEAVVRGCRSACVGTPEITCCELNRCNQQAFAMPTLVTPQALAHESKATKPLHPTVLFFVTILLVLQTVVKVAFV
ncbi:uncharacterized protein LOC123872911 [Maniola jurtina]|uniref:uncharacterized protein LOC123872911 n=1 Tax=Maniola jurtina TaxID=191418 RepID=UPI001E686796|nr:uncharacterized protein LOC123872911 [Maniola jurtina]